MLMATGNILIADDDTAIRTVLSEALSRAGYDVRTTGNAATLWRWVKSGEGDLVITDVVMPDENAFELLPKMKKLRPELPIIVMSAQNTFMTAIKASERGAYDYLPKPFDLRELVSIVGRAMSEPKNCARAEPNADLEGMPLVGRSAAMQEIYRALARLMQTDLTVMITGKSGTGKELVARALHDYGKRKKGPFVAINMAAIPRDLIESELFGHEKGAFIRGGTQRRKRPSSGARAATIACGRHGAPSLRVFPSTWDEPAAPRSLPSDLAGDRISHDFRCPRRDEGQSGQGRRTFGPQSQYVAQKSPRSRYQVEFGGHVIAGVKAEHLGQIVLRTR